MKNSLPKLFLAIFFVLPLIFSPCSKADVPGKLIAYNCYSCHGQNLDNLNLSPPLEQNKLIQTLLSFKYDKTVATIMPRITKGYTDSELKSVAAYINRLN